MTEKSDSGDMAVLPPCHTAIRVLRSSSTRNLFLHASYTHTKYLVTSCLLSQCVKHYSQNHEILGRWQAVTIRLDVSPRPKHNLLVLTYNYYLVPVTKMGKKITRICKYHLDQSPNTAVYKRINFLSDENF